MDPTELVKVAPILAPALQHIATTIVAGVPIAEILKSIILPTTDVLGKRMSKRIDHLFEKTGNMLEGANIAAQPVPEKILLPLLQGASIEDDDTLHSMWSALLANAASPEDSTKVKPGFVAVLRQMAPDEAALLQWMYEHAPGGIEEVDISAAPFTDTELGILADGLEASQLIRRSDSQNLGGQHIGSLAPKASSRAVVYGLRADKSYLLTDRGKAFYGACQPPKPKS